MDAIRRSPVTLAFWDGQDSLQVTSFALCLRIPDFYSQDYMHLYAFKPLAFGFYRFYYLCLVFPSCSLPFSLVHVSVWVSYGSDIT